MTAVNISGTFAKDERPMNGLESIAQQLVDDEFGTHLVIGRVKPHGYSKKPGEPLTPVVKFEHIEVVDGEFDEEWVQEKLDELYRARSKREAGPATPLPSPGQMDGQTTIDDAVDSAEDGDQGEESVSPASDIMLHYSKVAGWIVGHPGGAPFATTGDQPTVAVAGESDVAGAQSWAADEIDAQYGREVIRWAESTDQDGAWVAVLADDEGPVSPARDVWLDDK